MKFLSRTVKVSRPLTSGQTTLYQAGDDADSAKGVSRSYTALADATSTNIDSPHYAAATISFDNATKKMADSANGLATILTGDTVYIHNGLNNGAVFTVATGGVAGQVIFNEAPTTEVAGSYITVCKRVAWSNACVLDNRTNLTWLKVTSGNSVSPLKLGPASDGKLCFYDSARAFVIHPAGADLQMIKSSHILRIVGGAGEVGRYKVGTALLVAGFANAFNNRIGRWIISVTVNGADLDIVLGSWGLLSNDPARNDLINESAGGSRSIAVICQSILSLSGVARVANLGGHNDWRIPNKWELFDLLNEENGGPPDGTAFPNWPAVTGVPIWTSTSPKATNTNAWGIRFFDGGVPSALKTANLPCVFVRGG